MKTNIFVALILLSCCYAAIDAYSALKKEDEVEVIVVDRPPRPQRNFLEQSFFDGVESFADVLNNYPKEVNPLIMLFM